MFVNEILIERIPVKLWVDTLDEAALKQARNLANLPFAFPHIAVMPGAGRLMGRGEAQRVLDLAAERAKLENKGIIHALRSARDLDEAAGAYKDIDQVMARQRDLTTPVLRLTPLGVIKG